MARTRAEILTSLIAYLKSVHAGVDVTKGPIYDLLLRPVPAVVEQVEQDVERLARLLTQNVDAALTDEEVDALAASFGLVRDWGRLATGVVVFYAYQQPTTDLTVPRGTVVASAEGTYRFVTTDDRTLPAATAAAYYVSSRRRYELRVPVEAQAVGEDYNLPAGRITRLEGSVFGFDGVVNLEPTSGGLARESSAQLIRRIRARLIGPDPVSGRGYVYRALDHDPTRIDDAVPVYVTDPEWTRPHQGPAIDLFLYDRPEGRRWQAEWTLAQAVSDGQLVQIPSGYGPIVQLDEVRVDGQQVSGWALWQDYDDPNWGTVDEVSYISGLGALSAGTKLTVAGRSDELVQDLQAANLEPFGTTLTVRRAKPVQIDVMVIVRTYADWVVERQQVTDEVAAVVGDYLDDSTWVELKTPEELRGQILAQVAGVAHVDVAVFRPTRQAVADVMPVRIPKGGKATAGTVSIRVDD